MKVLNELLQVEKNIIAESDISAQILKSLDDIVIRSNYTVTFSDKNIALVASKNYRVSDTIVVTQNLDMMNNEIIDQFSEIGNETVAVNIRYSSEESQSTPLSVYSFRK